MDENSSCKLSVNVIHSSLYTGIITGEIVVSFIAVGPNLLLAWTIWRVTVFPVNLRLLLAFVSLAFSWLCLGDIIKNKYILSSPPCAFTMGQLECRIFDLAATGIAVPCIFYSLTALCVERTVATVIYNRYDNPKWHNKPYLAIALIIVVLSTALFMYTWGAFSLPTDKTVPVCESSFLPSYPLGVYNSQIYLAIEIAEACVTIFIYFFNLRVSKQMAINRARFNLSSRFLISQNVQINSMVVPMMSLHFVIHIPAFLMSNVQKGLVVDPLTKSAISRSSILLRLIYATTHPIIAFHFNGHLRDQLFLYRPLAIILGWLGVQETDKAKNGKQTQQQGTLANNLAVHFDHLEQIWERAKAPITKIAPKIAWTMQAHPATPVLKKETKY